ncbi:hypothetical protein [Candidatus Coxiella mudrowiae]|uniref:hypothetical protein n=1 Tax=Candidatus Coxiella mudrowiae TaxID=2054173 RepID=UPI0006621441|nr:hypothetical protein [Candidatus Coxiella mudrowiae]
MVVSIGRESTNQVETFTNKTTADGLGSNMVFGVYTQGKRPTLICGYLPPPILINLAEVFPLARMEDRPLLIEPPTVGGLGNNSTRGLAVTPDGQGIYVGTLKDFQLVRTVAKLL